MTTIDVSFAIPQSTSPVPTLCSVHVEEGRGDVRFERSAPLRIFVSHARATGLVGEYKVAATIDDTDIMRNIAAGNELPLQFETVSAPRGAPPLSKDEIAMRLTGVTDIASILEGKQQFWSPVYSLSQRWLAKSSSALSH